MGNLPGAKIPEKWERKWKVAPRLKWPKNGNRNGKMAKISGPKSHFRVPFPFWLPFFGHSRVWGHFPLSFPFFRDFCSGQVSHSVNGHFDRKDNIYSWANKVYSKGCSKMLGFLEIHFFVAGGVSGLCGSGGPWRGFRKEVGCMCVCVCKPFLRKSGGWGFRYTSEARTTPLVWSLTSRWPATE